MLFMSAFVISCSSDSDDPVNPGTGETFFNYTIDGEDVTMTTFGGIRSESDFSVSATAANGKSFQITFNEFGDLGDLASFSVTDFNFPSRMNHSNFRKHYFTFELVSVTATQVKVNFSGKVYDDSYDLTSNFSTVEGSFLVNYTTVQPQVPGLGVSAKINGNEWHAVSSYISEGSDYSLNYEGDDEYILSFIVDPDNLVVGNHTFTTNSVVNKVTLSKYDLGEGYHKEGTSLSGTFNITSAAQSIISGTFTLNAEDPSGAAVTVTDGKFKTLVLD